MKLKTKTELRILGTLLLVVAAIMAVGTALVAPYILILLRAPWQERFTSQFYQQHILALVRDVFLILLPCLVFFHAWIGLRVLQYAKRIPDAAS